MLDVTGIDKELVSRGSSVSVDDEEIEEEEKEEEEEEEAEDFDEEGTVVTVDTSPHFLEDHGAMHVVFVHGLKGGRLVDRKTRKCIWLKPVKALRHAPELCCGPEICGMTFPDEKYHEIDADGPLKKVCGGIFQVYGPFVKACKHRWGDNFHAYSYDWRRNIADVAKELAVYLSDITKIDPPRLLIVVHSMGGLVTWAMLSHLSRKCADSKSLSTAERKLIEVLQRSRILFCSTPFNPITSIVEDCTWGTRMHSAMLPAKKSFTFPTAYQLMLGPRTDPQFAPFYDVENWTKLRLGIFADKKITPEIAKECAKALPRMLSYADDFRTKELLPDFKGTPFEGLPTAVVASKAYPTPSRISDDFFSIDESSGVNWMEERWTKIEREEGDHRVTYANATDIPKGLSLTKIHLTQNNHTLTLNDIPTIFTAINDLITV